MKISKIDSLLQFSNYQNKNEKEKADTSAVTVGLKSYPKGYRPYFGARLFRTPENFYEQEFNKKGMPKTMADYLNANYAVNSKIPPAELSKKAFEDLIYCESVEDVKEMFPNEPLFQNLKTLETIRPTGGYLYQMRAYGLGNKEVLQSGEDLTVYLLKKIFLESKDLDEINYDFEKDRKPDLERDKDYCNEGAYFLHSTLNSIGIKLPDKSYWKSLQSNRTDKEYTPYTFVLKKPRKKPESTKPRVRKPLNLSPEEIQRRRDMMVNRWIDMTPAQRQAQIAKMKEGQKDSIFYQYSEPIMLIATDRAKFQDKMYQFFRENREKIGADAPEDLENMDSKQCKGMKLFWAQNNRIKKQFAYYIKATIREFEDAKAQGDEAIGVLLEKAANIMRKNIKKAIVRKYANPEFVKSEYKKVIQEQVRFFPDSIGKRYSDFILSHKRFNDELIPIKIRQLQSKDQDELLTQKVQKIMDDIYRDFLFLNKRDVLSSNTAVAVLLMAFLHKQAKTYDLMGMNEQATKIMADASETITANTGGIYSKILKYSAQDFIIKNKENINFLMQKFTKGLTDEQLKDFRDNIIDHMEYVVKRGNYRFLSNPKVRERCQKHLPKIYRDMMNSKTSRKELMKFLGDYEALYRHLVNLQNTCDYQKAHQIPSLFVFTDQLDYIFESIIDDYLIMKGKN